MELNREFYRHDWQLMLDDLRRDCAGSNVHFLDRDALVIAAEISRAGTHPGLAVSSEDCSCELEVGIAVTAALSSKSHPR